MELNQEILSDSVIYMKYARYIPSINEGNYGRKSVAVWNMMIEKYPHLATEIRENRVGLCRKGASLHACYAICRGTHCKEQ